MNDVWPRKTISLLVSRSVICTQGESVSDFHSQINSTRHHLSTHHLIVYSHRSVNTYVYLVHLKAVLCTPELDQAVPSMAACEWRSRGHMRRVWDEATCLAGFILRRSSNMFEFVSNIGLELAAVTLRRYLWTNGFAIYIFFHSWSDKHNFITTRKGPYSHWSGLVDWTGRLDWQTDISWVLKSL